MVGDVRGRLGILKVHTKKTPLSDSVDLDVIAKGTPGFTGADLANLVNRPLLMLQGQTRLNYLTLILKLPKIKVLMGPERKSMVIDKEKGLLLTMKPGTLLLV